MATQVTAFISSKMVELSAERKALEELLPSIEYGDVVMRPWVFEETATASDDRTARLWDAATGQEPANVTDVGGRICGHQPAVGLGAGGNGRSAAESGRGVLVGGGRVQPGGRDPLAPAGESAGAAVDAD